MNRAPLRLTGDDVAEEVDKGGARVPRHRLAEHFARLGIQRGEERQRAVAVVLEAVSLGASGRQWQHRIEAGPPRVLSPDLEAAHATFELGSFLSRQRQRTYGAKQ